MSERLRCPFVASPCVEEQCIGWRKNHCFIEELVPITTTDSGILSILKDFLGSRQQESEPISDTPTPERKPTSLVYPKKESETPIFLSLDLGTAYSKAAYRKLDNPIPIDFLSQEFVLPSDIVFHGDVFVLSRGATSRNLIQDVKTQFRQGPLEPCRNIFGENLPIKTSECIVYLYYVLLKRSFDLIDGIPSTIKLTVPSLAFVSQQELESWYRDAIRKAYGLALHISKKWDESVSIEEIRSSPPRIEYPEITVVSEPTAALVDLIHEIPDHVFAVVDVGAGTTDIAVMARFDGKDSILAEDTVPSGGRFIQRLFHRMIGERFGIQSDDLATFHRLLRDESTQINGNRFTLDDLFSDPDALAWAESVHNRLIEVKSRAQAMNYIKPSIFVQTLTHNVYISGGMGRCALIRRLVLRSRVDAPKPIPVPRTCAQWAVQVGNEADDLFLQLAPVVGALSLNAREMGSPPERITVGHRTPREDYDSMRGNLR